ncbi:MAG: hypothetical protein AAFW98_08450, partial [Pseudomonadota bacterium]
MELGHLMGMQQLRCISITPVELHNKIWLCIGFEETDEDRGDFPHLAMIYLDHDWLADDDLNIAVVEKLSGARDMLVRVHSECILGDALGSSMCDCRSQLALSMEEMVKQGEGIFIYLRQEGRGIGLRNKLDCLGLQYGYLKGRRVPRRYSSDEANLAMGHEIDCRSYDVAANLLRALKVASVRMITGNPDKIADLKSNRIDVTSALDLWANNASARAL